MDTLLFQIPPTKLPVDMRGDTTAYVVSTKYGNFCLVSSLSPFNSKNYSQTTIRVK